MITDSLLQGVDALCRQSSGRPCHTACWDAQVTFAGAWHFCDSSAGDLARKTGHCIQEAYTEPLQKVFQGDSLVKLYTEFLDMLCSSDRSAASAGMCCLPP